jgi:hypothetical protein
MTDAFLSPNQKHKTTRVDRILLIVRDHGMNSLRSGMVPERARSAPGRPGQSVAGRAIGPAAHSRVPRSGDGCRKPHLATLLLGSSERVRLPMSFPWAPSRRTVRRRGGQDCRR